MRVRTGLMAAGTPTMAAVAASRMGKVVWSASSIQPKIRLPPMTVSGAHHQMARMMGQAATMAPAAAPVMRPQARPASRARIGCHLLAATIAASKWHPVLALLAGLAFGLITGAIAAAIVAAWPVLRAIWWWAPETVVAGGLVAGWIEFAEHTTLPYRLAFAAVMIAIPVAVKNVRTGLSMFLWCFITRHRIRTCFSEFIITNRTGSLPLILWVFPTAVGERVWIWLRPGLSLDDLLDRLDKIAVACWATAAVAEAASRSNAALIRVDIKRRDALLGTITSPLMAMIKSGAPATQRDTADIPTALDLPQVPATEVIPVKPTPIRRPDPTPRMPGPASSQAPAASDGSDIADWI